MAMLHFDYDLVIWLKTIIVNGLKDKIGWGDNIWFKNLQKKVIINIVIGYGQLIWYKIKRKHERWIFIRI